MWLASVAGAIFQDEYPRPLPQPTLCSEFHPLVLRMLLEGPNAVKNNTLARLIYLNKFKCECLHVQLVKNLIILNIRKQKTSRRGS